MAMSDRQHPTRDQIERFGDYLDALVGDRRPAPHDVVEPIEPKMARLAAELTGSSPADPDPAFVDQLRRRVREVDEGVASVRNSPPLDPVSGGRVRISRRTLLQLGLGSAAGLAAGAVGISLLRPTPAAPAVPGATDGDRIVTGPGEWVGVASIDQLPSGEAVRFSTPEFEGYVVNDAGEIRALSAVCTHMACTLHFRREQQDLRCPCHGASFDLRGELANGVERWPDDGEYGDDARAYPIDLPPLSRPRVKVEGDRILVWIARA
jgi:nitrite reductase/ring-hydroxylating ferredoxin subunit